MALLNDGKNVFKVRAIDKLGNASQVASSVVLIDTVPPEIGSLALSFTRTSDESANFVLEVLADYISDESSGLNDNVVIKVSPLGTDTWFQENFSLQPYFVGEIAENGGYKRAENAEISMIVPSPLSSFYRIEVTASDFAGNEITVGSDIEVDVSVVIGRD